MNDIRQECITLLDQNRSIEEIANDLKMAKKEVQTYLGEDVLIRKAMEMKFEQKEVIDISNYLDKTKETVEKWFRTEIEYPELSELESEKLLKELMTGERIPGIALKHSITTKLAENFLIKHITCDYIQLISLSKLEEIYHRSKIKKIKPYLASMQVKLLNKNEMVKLVKHYNNGNWNFWKPFDRLMFELLFGSILGDGYLSLNTDEDEKHQDINISDYEKAVKFFEWIRNNISDLKNGSINLSLIIEQFNKYSRYIIETPTAYFRLHKSIVEKRWVTQFGNLLNTFGYNVNLTERLKTDNDAKCKRWYICLDSKASVQLFDLYRQFYKNGKKIVPQNTIVSETILLALFVDDGSFAHHALRIYTDSFIKKDVIFLGNIIEGFTGIKFAVYPKKDRRKPDKLYFILQITSKEKFNIFFNYLSSSILEFLDLAKNEFPWKFDAYLTKKETLESRTDRDYIQKYFQYIPLDE